MLQCVLDKNRRDFMKIYIYVYNVVAIKANLSSLIYEEDSKFVLIGSDYCINNYLIAIEFFFMKFIELSGISINRIPIILNLY